MTPVDAAQDRAESIRATLSNLVADRDRVLNLIREARDEGDHDALGYPSWTAYVSGEFGQLLPKLTRAERQPLVAQLRSLGMTPPTIAPVVGVDTRTVQRDVRNNTTDVVLPPATGADGRTWAPTPAPRPAKATEHRLQLERKIAAFEPFRALLGKPVEQIVTGVDALLAGHDWEELDKVANRHPQLDARTLAVERLHQLREVCDRLLAAWDTDSTTTLRRIK